MSEALFRNHLARDDLDWLPPRYAAIRWTVEGGIWAGLAAAIGALAWSSHMPWFVFYKVGALAAGGGYFVADRVARSVLRARLRKLAHGEVDLKRLPEEPDGELIHVVGRVRVLKPIVPLIGSGRAAYRRVVYHIARHRMVHEAAEDFWLDADEGEPALVEVAQARLLAAAPAFAEFRHDHPVISELEALPVAPELEDMIQDMRIDRRRALEWGRPPLRVKASEVIVKDGDRVEVLGYKGRTVDPTVAMRLARDTPFRATLRGGNVLPLLIAPMAPIALVAPVR